MNSRTSAPSEITRIQAVPKNLKKTGGDQNKRKKGALMFKVTLLFEKRECLLKKVLLLKKGSFSPNGRYLIHTSLRKTVVSVNFRRIELNELTDICLILKSNSLIEKVKPIILYAEFQISKN